MATLCRRCPRGARSRLFFDGAQEVEIAALVRLGDAAEKQLEITTPSRIRSRAWRQLLALAVLSLSLYFGFCCMLRTPGIAGDEK